MSSIVWVLERVQPMDAPLPTNRCWSFSLPSFAGGGFRDSFFNIGASTGGTDIIAMIVKKIQQR